MASWDKFRAVRGAAYQYPLMSNYIFLLYCTVLLHTCLRAFYCRTRTHAARTRTLRAHAHHRARAPAARTRTLHAHRARTHTHHARAFCHHARAARTPHYARAALHHALCTRTHVFPHPFPPPAPFPHLPPHTTTLSRLFCVFLPACCSSLLMSSMTCFFLVLYLYYGHYCSLYQKKTVNILHSLSEYCMHAFTGGGLPAFAGANYGRLVYLYMGRSCITPFSPLHPITFLP